MISLLWPWALAALPLPFILRLLLPRAKKADDAALRVPDLSYYQVSEGSGYASSSARWPLLLYTLAWVCLVIAASRPQWTGDTIELPVSGRDLMLAIDISKSMDHPIRHGQRQVSRIAATKAVASDFIARRDGDRRRTGEREGGEGFSKPEAPARKSKGGARGASAAPKPAARGRGEPSRRRQKLTITSALEGDGERTLVDVIVEADTISNMRLTARWYGPEGLCVPEPAVACEECAPDDDPEPLFEDEIVDEMTLEEMAEIAPDYRPDATADPELFADVNLAPQAVSRQNVFLIQDMMRDVIRRGTGRRALVLGRNDLSGKTGTSNDRRDAWFGGFNADLAAVVWVGYDDDLPLGPGEEGSRTALPIWIDFARLAFDGVPENRMPMPDGIVSVLIDRETGCPARAGQGNVVFEVFREGHVPECERAEEVPDIFNDASAIDPKPDEESPEDEETIF